MGLTVLNVAYPFAPVGPDAVGGAEQVLTQLDHALAQAGANSLVLASAGSKTRGTLFSHSLPSGDLDHSAQDKVRRGYKSLLNRILHEHRVDLVHLHGIDFAGYLPDAPSATARLAQPQPNRVPVLVTLHLPLDWYPPGSLLLDREDLHFNCVSESQRNRASGRLLLLPVIPNGIPVHQFSPRAHGRNFVAAIGRICREKGFHLALDAARIAGTPMLLAGRVFPYPEHQRYFSSEILPRLSPERRFIGPVNFRRKTRLLAASRCLLVPSLAPETSSLVSMEALASGTPVIAFPSGALAEIIQDGVTGFLVENEREMARAIARVGQLQPAACRAQARDRFSVAQTTAAYLRLYRELAHQSPAQIRPVVQIHEASLAS